MSKPDRKIVTIVGARPQFIKAAIVSKAIRERNDVKEVLVHTGQHYDRNMSDVFFDELGVSPPDYHLGVGSGSHGAQTGLMLTKLEEVMLKERPEMVLVYGDTNSTLAGALAAVKLHIPVAHVEAGLRSGNRAMPEEINRILTDHASDILFAPTEAAVENLRREGIGDDKVYTVGDVMYDATLHYGREAEVKSLILNRLHLNPGGYALATVHRAESTDDQKRLAAIFDGLRAVAAELPVILPLHPRTRAALKNAGVELDAAVKSAEGSRGRGGLQVIEPVGYLDMMMLEKNAAVIVTDSGGVQKEAFFHRVPCVTLRRETEWVELVDLGWNCLVDPEDPGVVADRVLQAVARKGLDGSPYGDGTAAHKIAELIGRWLSCSR